MGIEKPSESKKKLNFGQMESSSVTREDNIEVNIEEKEWLAEEELEELLDRQENAFLLEHEMNRRVIEDESMPATERLEWARDKINKRLESTFKLNRLNIKEEDLEGRFVSTKEIKELVSDIQERGYKIGQGGDAMVFVIDGDEGQLKAKECYKVAIDETIKRGRNSTATEVEFQGEFYKFAKQLNNTDIAVPLPLFEFEAGSVKLIAMEKLTAKSVDDILRGFGKVPEWLDIDRFCDSLQYFLDKAHEAGLYHRDMHFGNIMISQKENWQEGESMGQVIDFGLSGYGQEGFDPYKKEVAGETFTYANDCVRIPVLRKELHAWRRLYQKSSSNS